MIEASIAVEGAADFFFGPPLDENPYSKELARVWWESWRRGWLDASSLEQTRGDPERRRWWRNAA